MTTALVKQETGIAPQDFFSSEQRKMIRDTFLGGASDPEAAVLMEVARVRRLNPITRQIHFLKRSQWDPDTQSQKTVWSCQTSIDGLRAVAERTGRYDGQDEPEFAYEDKRLVLARVRVYKTGIARPFVGIAHFREYAQFKKDGQPTKMWAEKPHVMLAKCAEALALRKAFPDDTSGLYTEDELPQAEAKPAPPPPVVRRVDDDGTVFDGETGEVISAGKKPITTNDTFAADLQASAMIAECQRGFRNWDAKRAWATANTEVKAALSPEARDRVTAAFKAAPPTTKPRKAEEAPPPDGPINVPNQDDVADHVVNSPG